MLDSCVQYLTEQSVHSLSNHPARHVDKFPSLSLQLGQQILTDQAFPEKAPYIFRIETTVSTANIFSLKKAVWHPC